MKHLTEDDIAALEHIQANIRAFSDMELAYELARRDFRPTDYRRVFAVQYAKEQIESAKDDEYGEVT